jgi:hypothetical protein
LPFGGYTKIRKEKRVFEECKRYHIDPGYYKNLIYLSISAYKNGCIHPPLAPLNKEGIEAHGNGNC